MESMITPVNIVHLLAMLAVSPGGLRLSSVHLGEWIATQATQWPARNDNSFFL
jgi:hypothetical protein